MGLLILRVTLGTTVLFQSGKYLFEPHNITIWTGIVGILGIICGTLLLVGCLTPIVSAIIVAGGGFVIILFITNGQYVPVIPMIYGIILSAAMILLGPGAFSVDARLFGRREIIIPKGASAPKI